MLFCPSFQSIFTKLLTLKRLEVRGGGGGGGVEVNFNPLCITASGNILTGGNLCFTVFKLQLKVVNKDFCYLHSV